MRWSAVLACSIGPGGLLSVCSALAQSPAIVAEPEAANDGYTLAESYSSLRSQALEMAPQEPGSEQVLAVLMEMGLPDFVASLVTTADGSVSLYYSNGNSATGLGQDRVTREVASVVREHAAGFVSRAKPAESYPLPARSRIRFYIVTPQGIVTSEAPETEFATNKNEFSGLYFDAQAIISAFRLSQQEPPPDYVAARMTLAANEDYKPYRYTLLQPKLLDEHRRLIQESDSSFEEVITPLLQLLNEYPLSIQGNYALAAFLREVAEVQDSPQQSSAFILESARRRAAADAIVASIMDSREGTSLEDAFVVINQVEEYAVMDSMRVRPTTQALRESDNAFYDVFDVMDESGKKREVFFDISRFVPQDQ